MRMRWFAGVAAVSLAAVAMAPPARSQENGFHIEPAVNVRAVGGSYTIRWSDNDQVLDEARLRSITWYYASQADGADRKRVVTLGREDFTGGLFRWRQQGGIGFAWRVATDRRLDRKVASCRDQGIPIVSVDPTERDVVVSALVKPHGIRRDFALGVRVQQNGQCYEVRNTGNQLRILQAGKVEKEKPLFELANGSWYWYEISLRTRKKDVQVRARVFDEKREKVLAAISDLEVSPPNKGLLAGGLIALWGPADFADIYVDPWSARWTDDTKNELRWDTSQVPDGDYYVFAELVQNRTAPLLVRSPFQVQVRNAFEASR